MIMKICVSEQISDNWQLLYMWKSSGEGVRGFSSFSQIW